eukprot:CAMPEP_0184685552 /NCGR_PEP_ID=MMETSP0312-20130426/19401_1 /TAXON_ID=31354 /ORGANISM="Compsopogon coeruleus, Strain SAG 36.94" /LENGTH=33 /DNA_ID= /DNA_START= /DNA_END= /DNA_ORIENTATION=
MGKGDGHAARGESVGACGVGVMVCSSAECPSDM